MAKRSKFKINNNYNNNNNNNIHNNIHNNNNNTIIKIKTKIML